MRLRTVLELCTEETVVRIIYEGGSFIMGNPDVLLEMMNDEKLDCTIENIGMGDNMLKLWVEA